VKRQDIARSITTFASQQGEVVKRMIHEARALQDDISRERAAHRKVRQKVRYLMHKFVCSTKSLGAHSRGQSTIVMHTYYVQH
jgi:hypothetical protein